MENGKQQTNIGKIFMDTWLISPIFYHKHYTYFLYSSLCTTEILTFLHRSYPQRMSAAAETINVEEKFSGSSLNGSQAGLPDGADNLFAPDSESEFYLEENGTSNGLEHNIDPRVRRYTI